MGSVSSEDELERFERYSTLSADESESETWRGCDHGGADYSPPRSSPAARCRFSGESSFRAPIPVKLPASRGGNILAIPQTERLTEMADILETTGASGRIGTI